MKISRSILLRMRNISDKFVKKKIKIKTHISYPITPPPPKKKNVAVYEKMWKNKEKPDRPQMTI